MAMESFFSERARLCAELQELDARGAVLPQQPLSWGGRKKHQTGSLGLACFPRNAPNRPTSPSKWLD